MEEETQTLADYLEIASRRRFHIAIPFVIIALVALVVALRLPAVYRSTGTILIQDPQVPANMVQATITEYAAQRIQRIKQRVMISKTVLGIMDKYRLYAQERGTVPEQDLVLRFQESAELALVSADTGNTRDPRQQTSIAFTIAFSDPDPEVAQAVAAELVNLFLDENVRTRTERTKKATEFLTEESEKIKLDLQKAEEQIATYKEKYGESLPEMLTMNLTRITQLNEELGQIESQSNIVKERIGYLTAELARTDAVPAIGADRNVAQSPEEHLASLKAEYARLVGQYRPSHPDLQRLKRQIEALEPGFSTSGMAQEVVAELADARQQLDELRQKYSETHPDVIKLKQRVDSLTAQAQRSQRSDRAAPRIVPRSPAQASLLAQLNSGNAELDALNRRRTEVRRQLELLQQRISEAPQVEKGYQDLLRERDSAMKRYGELREKAVEAKLAQTLEEENRGETFTLLEPPTVPLYPEKTGRRKVFLMGIMFGLASGVGTATLAEIIDPKLRGRNALRKITGIPPIVVIPYIDNEDDLARHRRERKYLWIALAIAALIFIVVIHIFVVPLDELWLDLTWSAARL